MPSVDAVAVLCSRLKSSRIPEKALLKIAGIPATEHILSRLAPLREIGIPTILAVPENEVEIYRPMADKYETILSAGFPDSPLHRTQAAVKTYFPNIDYVIRVTGDDLIIDAQTAMEVLNKCRKEKSGYGIAPKIVEGAGIEVISVENLNHAADKFGNVEFISYFVKGRHTPNPKISIVMPRLEIIRPYRLTMDYNEDAIVLDVVLRNVGPFSNVDRICEFLDCNAAISALNRLPSISFYTCARNAQKYISQTMQSVAHATDRKFEHILIDDYSTDETLANIIVNITAKFICGPFKNFNHLGLASSSNLAVGHALGKWIMRVDADDILISGMIDKFLAFAEAENADMAYAPYRHIDENGHIISDIQLPHQFHHAGCALMRRSFINEIKFKDGIQIGDSIELFNRAKEVGKIVYFDMPVWLYRRHKDSLTYNNQMRNFETSDTFTKDGIQFETACSDDYSNGNW